MSERAYELHEEKAAARRPALKQALTVRGPVREDRLGTVLPHEHLLFDLRAEHEPFYPELADAPVELQTLGRLRRHPATCRHNLLLDDAGLVQAELVTFAHAGGGTVADLTCRGPRPGIGALLRLADESGLHIIASTGLYAPRFYPLSLATETAAGLAAQFAADVEKGIDGTEIRAGVIGKLEIPSPEDALQAKVLRAAARASVRTGAPLAVECAPGEGFNRVHRLLQEERVPPSKVLLCGMDRPMAEEERRRAAELGYYLLFDGFGQEHYVRGGEARTPRDPERVRWLKALVEGGFLRQLLLSQGINRRMYLTRYGGWGYAHILRNVVPMMERERLAPKQITTMLMYNPARALAFLEGDDG